MLLGRLWRALQSILRGYEPPHHLEITVSQLQACVGPNLNNSIEFIKRNRIDFAPDLVDRPATSVTPLAALDVIARFSQPLPWLRQNVDEAHVPHLLCRVDASAEHHLFRKGCPHTARHQAIGSHTGEQTEYILREAEFRITFG